MVVMGFVVTGPLSRGVVKKTWDDGDARGPPKHRVAFDVKELLFYVCVIYAQSPAYKYTSQTIYKSKSTKHAFKH